MNNLITPGIKPFESIEDYNERKVKELRAELSALRARVEALEAAAAKLILCHEQDEDESVHGDDMRTATYFVLDKYERDFALEELAFIVGPEALKA